MKSNNYYAEKDKYLLKMIDFLDEKLQNQHLSQQFQKENC